MRPTTPRSQAQTSGHCSVCGSDDIFRDEVIEHGTLLLAECGRCEQRWIWREPESGSAAAPRLAGAGRGPRRPYGAQEVASAA